MTAGSVGAGSFGEPPRTADASLFDPRAGTSSPGAPVILSAGIVAHNEDNYLETAVRSLLEQDLPSGVWWHTLWIVASGCTDRTVEVAERLAAEDPRVRVVVEPERLGKAHALREVFRRATGNALVLLNADARAEPGAVAALVRAASPCRAPFAVMARPVVPPDLADHWAGPLRTMWDLHHEFHLELQQLGGGAHLSDELLLVSLPRSPPLPDGIVNDGSFLGVWLAQHGGCRAYAPEARVTIEVPRNVRDHLHQRRRIIFGNGQVMGALGARPSTLVRYALRSPKRALTVVRRSVASHGRGLAHLVSLVVAESVAMALATWDWLPPRKDHVRWRRIRASEGDRPAGRAFPSERSSATEREPLPDVERRVTAVVTVASRFGTGVSLPELVRLLPGDAPSTVPEVRSWLEARPHLAHVADERAFARTSTPVAEADRSERGRRYVRAAQALFSGPMRRLLPLVRCVCVTGSAAYGSPEPGDDLDLFVVTRKGSLWWFLANAYVALRRTRAPGAPVLDPIPCFNFVLEEGAAVEEFARSRGFMFAREALTAHPVYGADCYRALLAQASWMADEIPRLYAEKTVGADSRPVPSPVPPLVRILNVSVFPWLAAYLQLVGLYRDGRFRRAGQNDQRFRTDTRWRRLAFASRKFDRLRENYRTAAFATSARPAGDGPELPAAHPEGDDGARSQPASAG